MVYDSELSETINTAPSGLVFVSPTEGRFAIQAKIIIPTKSLMTKNLPLPRVVTYNDDAKKTGFGLTFPKTKRILQGGRQEPKVMTIFGPVTSADRLRWWKAPLSDDA